MYKIRPVELRDVPRCAEINTYGWRNAYRGIIPDDYLFGDDFTVATRLLKWEKLANDKNPNNGYYVYDDDIVKAFMTTCKCIDDDKPNSFEIMAIYVEPLMKRQGIGTSLIKFAEKRAKDLGYSEICLWCYEDNTNSRKFYEQMGYKLDGKTKTWELYNRPDVTAREVRFSKTLG